MGNLIGVIGAATTAICVMLWAVGMQVKRVADILERGAK